MSAKSVEIKANATKEILNSRTSLGFGWRLLSSDQNDEEEDVPQSSDDAHRKNLSKRQGHDFLLTHVIFEILV